MSEQHEKLLSQKTYDRMVELIIEIRHHAVDQKDAKLYGMADTLHALVHRFVNDMLVDGTVAGPNVRRQQSG